MSTWYTRDVDGRIARTIDSIRKFRFPPTSKKSRAFITISRQVGCDSYEVANGLAQRLTALEPEEPPWEVFDRILVELVAKDAKISDRLVASMTSEHRSAYEGFLSRMVLNVPSQDQIFRRTARVIKSLAWHGHAIIVGRGGFLLCSDMPGGFHIQIVAPLEWRLERISAKRKFETIEQARNYQSTMERAREQFYQYHFHRGVGCGEEFDMIINNNRFSVPQIVELIVEAMKYRKLI